VGRVFISSCVNILAVAIYLTEELRRKLKNPLGELIEGPPAYTISVLKRIIASHDKSILITVGDFVTYNVFTNNIEPEVCVIDYKTLRQKDYRVKKIIENYIKISVKNPPGTITSEAYLTLRRVLHAINFEKKYAILVEGEEDLLTLPAIVEAPLKSFVVYGQPHKGIVVVYVTEEKKKEIMEEYISKFKGFEDFKSNVLSS